MLDVETFAMIYAAWMIRPISAISAVAMKSGDQLQSQNRLKFLKVPVPHFGRKKS